jgi:hypothetical protein
MTKENYTVEDRRKYLTLQCRYYNGEEEDPFAKELFAHEVDKSHLPPPECMKYEYKLPPEQVAYLQNASTAWGYEKWWVEANLGDAHFKGDIEEYHAYGCKGFEENDGTPLTMKAMFWNRYYHWGGMLDPQSTNFKEWYKTYYQRRETNLQRRTKQRMVELTAKCRFYKGEKENPLANTEDELMWYYESVWVERLAQSYTNADSWNRELKLEHLDHLPKKYGVPSSLVGLLLNRYMHWANPYHPSDGFEDWLKSRYLKISK